MEAAVIYFSKTGHSKKIAQAIAKALSIRCEDAANNPNLDGNDLLFVVGGIYGGSSDPKLTEYLGTLDSSKVKKAVLVTSCCSKKSPQKQVREVLGKQGIEVLKDEFICPGNFLFMRVGHPDATDIANAVSFAKKVMAGV